MGEGHSPVPAARRVLAPARGVNTAAASALPARTAQRLARLRNRVAGATGAARASALRAEGAFVRKSGIKRVCSPFP